MSLSLAALKFLQSKGLTLEDVTTLADLIEAEKPTISKGAQATRKWRESKDQRSSSDHRVITGDDHGDISHVGAGPQVVTPSLPSLRSEELGGGGGAGERDSIQPDDWPAGNASRHAEMLVELIASPWLDPTKSPDLVTTRGRVAAWKRDGASWEHDVLAVVTGLCANRRAKISSWKFFDQAVARSIAENRAALEIPEACGRRQTGPPNWVDQIAATNAEARRRVLEAD